MTSDRTSGSEPGSGNASKRKYRYYVAKRDPVDQIFPDRATSVRNIHISRYMQAAIKEAGPLIKQHFELERKASVHLLLGFYCDLGVQVAGSANIAYSAKTDEMCIGSRVLLPDDTWNQLEHIKMSTARTPIPRHLKDLIDGYVKVGMLFMQNNYKNTKAA